MTPTIKALVGGEGNVGKTSLICRYTKGRFFDARNLTLGVDITTHPFRIGGEVVKLALFDIEGRQGERSGCYLGAQAALLVYDVAEPRSFEALPAWIDRYRKYCLDAPLLIMGNKLDLGQQVPPSWRAALARYGEAAVEGAISAKTGQGVAWAFETLAALAVQQATSKQADSDARAAWRRYAPERRRPQPTA
jgi:small GTP-binding protein